MARGINKVVLIGTLGKDPDVRYAQNSAPVSTISIATTESWKDKQGNQQEKTEWHRVVFFGRLAEIAGEYLKQGRQVYIEGKLRTNKWKDKEGADRYTTEILASEMQMLGGQPSPGTPGGGKANNNQSSSAQGFGNTPLAPSPAPQEGVPNYNDFDDIDTEVPF